MSKRFTLSALAICLMAGCVPNIEVVMLRRQGLPPTQPANIELWAGNDAPKCSYEIVGMVHASGTLEGVLERIRARVAQAGGDGVVQLSTAKPGTVGAESNDTTGQIYRCK